MTFFVDVKSFWIFRNLQAPFFKAIDWLTCGNVTEKIERTGLLKTLAPPWKAIWPVGGQKTDGHET